MIAGTKLRLAIPFGGSDREARAHRFVGFAWKAQKAGAALRSYPAQSKTEQPCTHRRGRSRPRV